MTTSTAPFPVPRVLGGTLLVVTVSWVRLITLIAARGLLRAIVPATGLPPNEIPEKRIRVPLASRKLSPVIVTCVPALEIGPEFGVKLLMMMPVLYVYEKPGVLLWV